MPEEVTSELKKVIAVESHELVSDIRRRAPSSDESAPLDWEGKPRVKLRDAYEVRISKDGLFSRIGIMGKKNRNQFFFATFLEFGFKHKGGGLIRRPHVRPAWNARRERVRRAIREATLRALRRVAGGNFSDV
jgi:hypothetical protein